MGSWGVAGIVRRGNGRSRTDDINSPVQHLAEFSEKEGGGRQGRHGGVGGGGEGSLCSLPLAPTNM